MRKFIVLSVIAIILGGAHPVLAAMHMLGEDESDKKIEAQMHSVWRACSESKDCSLIQYGCTGVIAANKKYVSEATDLAHKIGGNPAEIKCAPIQQPHYVSTCMNGRCVAANPTE